MTLDSSGVVEAGASPPIRRLGSGRADSSFPVIYFNGDYENKPGSWRFEESRVDNDSASVWDVCFQSNYKNRVGFWHKTWCHCKIRGASVWAVLRLKLSLISEGLGQKFCELFWGPDTNSN